MLEEETGKFAVLQVKVFEEVAGSGGIFAENGVDSGTDTAMREDQNVLVRVLFAEHGQKAVDAELKAEQGFFAVVGFSEAAIVVPDFNELKQGKFPVDFAKVAFEQAIVTDDFGHAGNIAGRKFGGFEGAAQRRAIDSVNLRQAVDDAGAGQGLLTAFVSERRVNPAAETVEAVCCYLAMAKEIQMCRHVIPPFKVRR